MKSVRFADDKDVDQLPLEQERDVVIYSSFLISKYFLEAILAGVFHGPKLSSEETDDSKQTEAESGQFLDECLTKVELGMAALYPLSYRVEILENLFSLLFLRYEDLSDGRDLHADSGEEEGLIEDDLTNLSITSLESLSSPVKVAGASDMFDLQSRHGAISRRLNFTDGASQSKSDKMVTELDLSTKEASLGLGPISSSVQHKTKVKDNRKSETQDQGNQSSEAFLLEASTGRHISSESLSQQSHLSTSQIGFLVSETVMKKLLMTLKNCLTGISKEKMALYGISAYDTVPHEKDRLLRYLNTSVALPNLAQRIASLTQYINEAWWRFQLVSESSVSVRSGSRRENWSSDEDLEKLGDILQLESASQKKKEKKRKRNSRGKRKSGEDFKRKIRSP